MKLFGLKIMLASAWDNHLDHQRRLVAEQKTLHARIAELRATVSRARGELTRITGERDRLRTELDHALHCLRKASSYRTHLENEIAKRDAQ